MENQLKATELRLGNLVKYKLSNIPQEIKSLISHEDDYYVNFRKSSFGNSIDKIEPIQITEDILVKLGFEPATNHDFVKANLFLTDFGGKYYRAFLGGSQRITKELTTVHQLQNVFFALTGEELTFKI